MTITHIALVNHSLNIGESVGRMIYSSDEEERRFYFYSKTNWSVKRTNEWTWRVFIGNEMTSNCFNNVSIGFLLRQQKRRKESHLDVVEFRPRGCEKLHKTNFCRSSSNAAQEKDKRKKRARRRTELERWHQPASAKAINDEFFFSLSRKARGKKDDNDDSLSDWYDE